VSRRSVGLRAKAGRTGAWCALTGLLLVGGAWACDTPVYLYTLQHWERDPYRVCYFHQDAEDASDAAVNGYLHKVSTAANGHANLILDKVNVSRLAAREPTSLERRLWAQYQSRKLPFYVVLTPRGQELFVGRLDLAAARALVSSPQRMEMAAELCRGKGGVLLLLEGPNTAENAAAAGLVRKAAAAAKERQQEVATVTVARNDGQEAWLVRQLLRVEDDLDGLESPMVFGVFGRGHVLEPYVGRGITQENITELVEFLSGPCSCGVKMAGLGVDLLSSLDWEAKVAALPQAGDGPVRWTLFDLDEDSAGAASAQRSRPVATARATGARKQALALAPKPAAEHSAATQPTSHGADVARWRGADDPADLEPAAATAFGVAQGEPVPRARAAAEGGPSFASVLARRVGVVLGAALMIVTAAGLILLKRAKQT